MYTAAILTSELSKRARRELGLSQNDVIKATGILAYKLKQWEGRGLSIELADIRKLSDFYESQGVNLAELVDHIGQSGNAGRDAQTSEASQALQDGFTYSLRPGFMISDQLAPEVVAELMERMEANDERIGVLTAETFSTNFFGDISNTTETKARELVGTLAENHIIFRCLQGRNIVSAMRDEPKTLGEFLTQMMKRSPVLPVLLPNAGSTSARNEPRTSTSAIEAATSRELE